MCKPKFLYNLDTEYIPQVSEGAVSLINAVMEGLIDPFTFTNQSPVPKSVKLNADQIVQVFSLRKAPPGFEGLGLGQEEEKEDKKSLDELAIEDAYNEFNE